MKKYFSLSLKEVLISIFFVVLIAGLAFLLNKNDLFNKKNNINSDIKSEEVPSVDSFIGEYLNIQKGDYWLYEGTKTEQVENGKILSNRIQKRIEVLDIQNTSEGKLIILEGTDSPNYLVQDDTLDFEPNDSSKDKFVLSFPLYVGQKWGDEESLRNRDDEFYVWHVEEKFSENILNKEYNECFKISFKTLPDTDYRIFCYGLGIIAEGYEHNGTILKWNYKLIDSNKAKL